MKRYSTLLLRIAIFVAGAVVIALCCVAGWLAFTTDSEADLLIPARVFLGGCCASAVPFFIALYQSFRLLGYIDTNRAFSDLSVNALKIITRASLAEFLICTLGGIPFFFAVAQLDDAPGMLIVGIGLAGVAFVIFVFARFSAGC